MKEKKANLKHILAKGAVAGLPIGVLIALLKKSYNAASGPNLVADRIPVLDIPITGKAKKIGAKEKSSGVNLGEAKALLNKAIMALKGGPPPMSKLDIIKARLRQATVGDTLGVGAGVAGGSYLGTKAWDTGETAYLKGEISDKQKALNDALIQEQEQRLKVGFVKSAFLKMRLAELYDMVKARYAMMTPSSRVLVGGLGIAAPAYTAGATYNAVKETDKNVALKKEIKKKLRERLSSGGGTPGLISLYGSGVQPFRRGAKALIDPSAGRDVLDL